MYNILVLLSSYNGEKYIIDQLDSIENQEEVSLKILIRDDGSKDNTCDLLKEYMQSHPNITLIEGKNVGFVKSFSILVCEATKLPHYDFYSFADQDDIWYSNKLIYGARQLAQLPTNLPNLFGSNSNIINSNGEITGKFYPIGMHYNNANLTYSSFVQGCSMLFNRKSLELYSNNQPSMAWHDRWMTMICTYMGNIVYVDEALFGYRIHNNNALMKFSSKKQRNKAIKIFDYIIELTNGESYNQHQAFLQQFYSVFSKYISEEDKTFILMYLGYNKSISKKMKMILSENFNAPYYNYKMKNSIKTKLEILFNKL